ncbi:MAG: C39 family peptidase, partial [Anaerolineae bacterium]
MVRRLVAIALLVMSLVAWSPATPEPDAALAERPIGGQATRIEAVAEGNRSRIDALDADGVRHTVAEEPFARLILPQFEALISLSPDGRTVAYVTADNESLANAELWLASTDGAQRQRLASFPRGLWITRPAWAPDGSALALTLDDPADTGDGLLLAIVRTSDGEQQRLRVPGLCAETFYGTPGDMVVWGTTGILLRDGVSAPGRILERMVDPATGNAALSVRPLTEAEALATLAANELPCELPPYAQTDPRWSDTVMQVCALTIGEAGCALTSAAMVFGYYGATRNPPQLSDCLGDDACPIYWGIAASSCSDGLASYVDYQSFSWDTLASTLAAGQPIIVRFVRDSNPGWNHFVVATAGDGESASGYTILDSWDGRAKSMVAYVGNGWSATGLVRYTGEPACLSGDDAPPVGGITAPLTDTLVVSPTLTLSGWASDVGGSGDASGLASAQFLVHDAGAWRVVGPTHDTSPFTHTWDICADGVPPGPLALGLRLRDRAGNEAISVLPLVHLTLGLDCAEQDRCQPPTDSIAVYAEPGYCGPCHILGPGDYATPWDWGLVGNDNVASVRVGADAQVTLYEHKQYGGRAETIGASDANLADNPLDAGTVTSARVLSRTASPETPQLDYPLQGALYDSEAVLTLAWHGAAGATSYRAELWSDPQDVIRYDRQPDTFIRLGSPAPGATYSWRVQGRGPGGESAWSETRTFTVAPRAPDDLVALPGCELVDLT